MGIVERKFKLQVPSTTENLAMIREFAAHVGSQAGLDEGAISRLELAVDEACANVIEHAYGSDVSKDVTVRAVFDEEVLEVIVEDTGLGFDPTAVPAEDIRTLVAERRTGGLGMQLMKSLMDEVHYEITPGQRNELRMVKRLRRPSGS
jgi:anti-sigma regulatory factor (Ser/Thr protein kinase)